jgi:hypothetical protein
VRPVAKKWIRGEIDRLAIEQGCYFDVSIGKKWIRGERVDLPHQSLI